jgi:2-iminobutanoate/2-iminopropanoate deaminase
MPKVPFSAPGAAPPVGAYSDAIEAGDFIFCTGQCGLDSEGNLVGETAVEQAQQAFRNLESLLAARGLTPDAVVKCTIFLTDFADFDGVNAAYRDFFKVPYPARETVAVKELSPGFKIEMAVTAYKG